MNYSSSSPDSLPFGDLSLNVFDSYKCWPQSPNNSHLLSHPHGAYSPPYARQFSSAEYQTPWSLPEWRLGSVSCTPAPYNNPPSPWDTLLPAYHRPEEDNLLRYNTYMPELQFPPSPSAMSSSASTDLSSSPSPRPQSLHVVCNAPLVAPVPLPYHSPTFLQFELPDIEEDLSHPPYTQRTSKRKRCRDEGIDELAPQKRRSLNPRGAPNSQRRSSGYISTRRHPVSGPKQAHYRTRR